MKNITISYFTDMMWVVGWLITQRGMDNVQLEFPCRLLSLGDLEVAIGRCRCVWDHKGDLVDPCPRCGKMLGGVYSMAPVDRPMSTAFLQCRKNTHTESLFCSMSQLPDGHIWFYPFTYSRHSITGILLCIEFSLLLPVPNKVISISSTVHTWSLNLVRKKRISPCKWIGIYLL